MPRNRQKPQRLSESARLRRLRGILGLTQRELAAEFKVAHGAVAAWESGAHTLPGPAVRLLEIYEKEMGLPPDDEGFVRLKTSSLSRSLALSRTAGTVVARAVGGALERIIADDAEAEAIRTRTQVAIARHLVRSLGELKGLATKIAQAIPSHDAGLSEEIRAEFDRLAARTRPMAPSVATQVVLEEFGEPPGRLFADWEARPFAAASIGQVHRARLPSGEPVAVKIQFPAIVETLRADLGALDVLDRLSTTLFRGLRRGAIVGELRERLIEECDYRLEADHQEAFRRLWAHRPGFAIPRVHADFTRRRVLVTDYAEGERFERFRRRAAAEARHEAGERIARFALESVFRHGRFVADLHPDNLLFRQDAVVFLDFGCVKAMSPGFLEHWRQLVRLLMERRRPELERLAVDLGFVPDPTRFDFPALLRVLEKLNEPWLVEGPFQFSPEYVEASWREAAVENRNKFRTGVPGDWFSANRMMWGLRSLLGQLGARVDCRSLMLDLLYPAPTRRPPPFARAPGAETVAPAN